jgi:hypothetical protein
MVRGGSGVGKWISGVNALTSTESPATVQSTVSATGLATNASASQESPASVAAAVASNASATVAETESPATVQATSALSLVRAPWPRH